MDDDRQREDERCFVGLDRAYDRLWQMVDARRKRRRAAEMEAERQRVVRSGGRLGSSDVGDELQAEFLD
jgi:hypothetical protein